MRTIRVPHLVWGICLTMLVSAAAPGCGMLSTVAYWIKGNKIEAKFKGLEGKRVAVVCLDADSLKGPGSEADQIARMVSTSLGYNVPDINLVRRTEVESWFDGHDQDIADYVDIGRVIEFTNAVPVIIKSLLFK